MGRPSINRELLQKKKVRIQKRLKSFVRQFEANKQRIYESIGYPEGDESINLIAPIEMFDPRDSFEFELEKLKRLKMD